MSIGKGHSSTNQQQTSTQALDPQVKAALLQNYGDAKNVAAANSTPYSGQLVAPMNDGQMQGLSALSTVGASGVGNSTLNSAVGAQQGLTGFAPTTVNAAQLSGADLSKYMNPFTQDVTNTTLNDLERSRQIANVSNDAQATQAGAFGGDRSAVLNSLTNEGYARTAASTLAGLNQANYTNAQGAAQGDIAAQNQVGLANQQAGIQGAGVRQAATSGLAGMSAQQLQQALAQAQAQITAGNQYQTQAQNVNASNLGQYQQNFQNQMSLQQLINQSLGLAGDPTLTQSQGTSKTKQSNWNLGFGGGGGQAGTGD